jgi:hypothetical protein
VLGKAKEEEKRISKDEGRKDTAVSWKKIVIIVTVHENRHGSKGTSPKSGRKEIKMKTREIISNTQYPITKGRKRRSNNHMTNGIRTMFHLNTFDYEQTQ